MGMYTEFIFGAELSKDTPKICIDALDYSINNRKDPSSIAFRQEDMIARTSSQEDIDDFIDKYDFGRLFHSCSYYFGAANPMSNFHYDSISESYHISTRADLKNYSGSIEKFIEYITPYIKGGSGPIDVFAYVQYEESDYPTIYSVAHGKESFYDPDIEKRYSDLESSRWGILEKLYSKLCPEYEVLESDAHRVGVENSSVMTSDSVWESMIKYILEKYSTTHESYDRGYREATKRFLEKLDTYFDIMGDTPITKEDMREFFSRGA